MTSLGDTVEVKEYIPALVPYQHNVAAPKPIPTT